jgi:GNAT superfamily N-acetyltransferase
MAAESEIPPALKIVPVTAERWNDLEVLFGRNGACGGCWCMLWRMTRSEFEKHKGDGNRRSLRKIVKSGAAPGLLAYAGADPVGWCAIAPRESYPALDRSRTLKPVDAEPVWSVTCFFIARPFRRRGVSLQLLRAAVEYAAGRGARIVEGYPVIPRKSAMPDVFAWTGLHSCFTAAGFQEVARRSPSRPIMRYVIEPARHAAVRQLQSRHSHRK